MSSTQRTVYIFATMRSIRRLQKDVSNGRNLMTLRHIKLEISGTTQRNQRPAPRVHGDTLPSDLTEGQIIDFYGRNWEGRLRVLI